MKFQVFVLFLLILIPTCFALQISEVEINPSGSDKGAEWIEFYSKEEINLGNYFIKNNDGDILNLSGEFKGYFVYSLEKQWLDNSDEKIFLYKENDLIDETEIFEDSLNDEFSWQKCEVWKFKQSTKQKENECEKIEEETEETILEDEKDTNSLRDLHKENKVEEVDSLEKEEFIEEKKSVVAEVIILNPKNIKSEDSKVSLGKSDYAIYGLPVFCVLLALLFIFRKKKNGFE